MDGQGDRRSAVACYQQAVDVFRETGDQWAITHPLNDLAWRTWDAGRLQQAVALGQDCLAVFRQLRSQGSVSMVLGGLSHMMAVTGDFAGAIRSVEEKSEIDFSDNLDIGRAYGLHSLAYVNFVQGHLALARQQLEEAAAIARAADNFGFTSDVVLLLGRIAACSGAADEATALFDEAQRWAANGDPASWRDAAILFSLGRVACLRNDFTRATALQLASLELVRGRRPEIPPRLEELARAALGQGQVERAATLLAAANGLRTAMGAPVLPVDRPAYQELQDAVRSALPEPDFRRAWNMGEITSADESVVWHEAVMRF